MRRLLLGWLGAGLLVGSGCATAARLDKAEQTQQRFQRELGDTQRALQSVNAYVADLRSPGASGPSFNLYYSPASLEQLASQLLPLRMVARTFQAELDGDVVLDRVYDIRFGPLNTFTCQALLHGENIRYTGSVPAAYQAQVRQFQAGVAAGVVMDLSVQLSLSGDHALVALARAGRARLKTNSTPNFESTLREQVNERVLKTPFSFDVSIQGSRAVPRRMVLTANHLVLTYAP